MKAKLVVVEGKAKGMEIPLAYPQFTIGRGERCNLRPNSELVSKEHCSVLLAPDRVSAVDLGSTNGTFVNGNRLEPNKPQHLEDEDLLKVGPLVFQVRIEGAVPAGKEVPEDEDDVLGWLNDSSTPADGSTIFDNTTPTSSDTQLEKRDEASAPPPPPREIAEPASQAEAPEEAPQSSAKQEKQDKQAADKASQKDTQEAAREALARMFIRPRGR